MQNEDRRREGVFGPEDLKRLSDELNAGNVPGETPVERVNRAAALLYGPAQGKEDQPD